MKKKILLILMFLMGFTGLVSADVQDETVCNNAVGTHDTHDGYFYKLWNESGGDGQACMTLKAGGGLLVVNGVISVMCFSNPARNLMHIRHISSWEM